MSDWLPKVQGPYERDSIGLIMFSAEDKNESRILVVERARARRSLKKVAQDLPFPEYARRLLPQAVGTMVDVRLKGSVRAMHVGPGWGGVVARYSLTPLPEAASLIGRGRWGYEIVAFRHEGYLYFVVMLAPSDEFETHLTDLELTPQTFAVAQSSSL